MPSRRKAKLMIFTSVRLTSSMESSGMSSGTGKVFIRLYLDFKDIFQKQDHDEWKVNTYFADKIEQTDKILKK